MRRLGLGLAAAFFGGVIACVVWMSLRCDEWVRPQAEPLRQKQYVRAVAEGVRFREFRNPGVDRFAFEGCRVEKRRSGAVTFGAFNVLVVDGLVLNLPEESAGSAEGDSLLKGGFAEGVLRSQGLGQARFSGVRINGLTVNRARSNCVERVFSASRAESGRGKGALRLMGCVVNLGGGCVVSVDHARLELKPALALVYRQDGVERRMEIRGFSR